LDDIKRALEKCVCIYGFRTGSIYEHSCFEREKEFLYRSSSSQFLQKSFQGNSQKSLNIWLRFVNKANSVHNLFLV